MKSTTTTEAVVGKAALFGVAGWAAENLLFGPRYSDMFHGHHVPFLPLYAAGGVAVMAAAPHIEEMPLPIRAVAYALLGTAVEFLGCQGDRKIMDGHAWDFGASDKLAKATGGCVDWKHAALWGVLGVVAEKTVLK